MREHVHGALVRQLAARGGAECRVVFSSARPWASITFEGLRHLVELELPGDAVDGFAAGLDEAEFRLRRHIVADLALQGCAVDAAGQARLRCEALTLADG